MKDASGEQNHKMKIASCFLLSILITSSNRSASGKAYRLSNFQRRLFTCGSIGQIPVPAGYKRVAEEKNSFGEWLRKINLKKDPRIYFYNGRLRDDQSTQIAVLDIPVGDKDLQQCADAIIRLRAEYFFSIGSIDSIHFRATDGTDLSFAKWVNGERYRLKGATLVAYNSGRFGGKKRRQLEQFLEVVFSYCGTISLSKAIKPVDDLHNLMTGDVFVKAGSPGHAMIVVDVASGSSGEKIFMLAQGFMPAQSIHIVKNPLDETMSPWYKITGELKIITPNWVFYRNQLGRW